MEWTKKMKKKEEEVVVEQKRKKKKKEIQKPCLKTLVQNMFKEEEEVASGGVQ